MTIDKTLQILLISISLGVEIKIKFEDVIGFEAEEDSDKIESIKDLENEIKKGKKIKIKNSDLKFFNLNYFPLIRKKECSPCGIFCCKPITKFSRRQLKVN